MVTVRFGVKPGFDIGQPFLQFGYAFCGNEAGVRKRNIAEPTAGTNKVAVAPRDALYRAVIFRSGEDVFIGYANISLCRADPVIGKPVHAKTAPFRLTNAPAVCMISSVSSEMSSPE